MAKIEMNDDEWRAFRVRYLVQHNIYLSDDQRPLYDASVSAPEPSSAPELTPATDESPMIGMPEDEAPSASSDTITRPQPVVDLLDFIGGTQ